MLVYRRVTPRIMFAVAHIDSWVERGTARVKCLALEHNKLSPARARTYTAQSRMRISLSISLVTNKVHINPANSNSVIRTPLSMVSFSLILESLNEI